MKRKENPTIEESKLAMEMQMPRATDEAQHETKAIARVSTFKQLAKVSRNARITFGGSTQWVQPERLFDTSYQNGLESVPFFVTKAWQYTSKSGYGERLGMEIVLSDGKMFMVGLGLNEGDIKRNNMISLFKEEGAQPIGPFILVKLPTNKGNDYYDLNPYRPENSAQTDEISFVEIDKDLPF